jgi:hypothetical protein
MRYLLKEIQDFMENDDGFRNKAANYSRTMKTDQLAFMQEAILIIKGIMMKDMFSYQHTNSDSLDKDVAQRTYYNINQILDFLSNPEGWLRKKSKLKQAYTNTAEKVMSRFRSGGTK